MTALQLKSLILLLFTRYGRSQISLQNNSIGCHSPMDIVFVLDASSSIWGPDFKRQLTFITKVIREFNISSETVRCGLLTYGDEVREEFHLRTYSNPDRAATAVNSVTQLRGSTRTDIALQRMRRMVATEGRPGVPHTGIVITDGESDYPAATRREAQMAHHEGMTVFAVGIGRGVNRQELKSIATKRKFVFKVDSYSGLERIRNEITSRTCQPGSYKNSQKAALLQHTQGCTDNVIDIVFILDDSGSIWGPDFRRLLNFVRDLVGKFQISENGVHVGVLTFGDKPQLQFDLDDYLSVLEIQSAVARIVQNKWGSNTGEALRYARLHVFNGRNHREEALKLAIVITDGQSDDPQFTSQEANLLRNEGVTLYAIGVGSEVNQTELRSIASPAVGQHLFIVENYTALRFIKTALLASTACAKIPTIETIQLLPKLAITVPQSAANQTTTMQAITTSDTTVTKKKKVPTATLR